MRYSLRTLLVLLAIVPPVLAGVWFTARWVVQSPDGQVTMLMLVPSTVCAATAILLPIIKRIILLAIGHGGDQERPLAEQPR